MSIIPTQPVSTRPIQVGPIRKPLTRSGFGRIIYEARPPGAGWRDFILLLLPVMLLVIALAGYAFWLWDSTNQRFGPAAALAWAAPWYLAAALAALVFLLVSLYCLHRVKQVITIYEGGLQVRLSPLRKLTFRWSEIHGISAGFIREQFFGLVLRNRVVARLHLQRSRQLRLPGAWVKTAEMVPILKSHLYPLLWPGLLADFQSGHGAAFGPVNVHPQGIRTSGQTIPWDQVVRLGIQSGYLLVESYGSAQIRLPVFEIPNLELLLQLLDTGINPSIDRAPVKGTPL
jgi:hypothetical protein